ncbi:alpha/beta fold hydrolase [Lysobacter sp. TY2-98]|uniref:YheT family hydrolase n=1 Tax=Lysobacter sp. TY2-98 TaxID=2290922 RepID=UPI000E1FE1EC|nr:alpha/beta fold hydrolase [Lysobacter sp. TY2-98]AXK73307.1 alpha/beta fold hydrolase [Lysobacter sp. TY2-98]
MQAADFAPPWWLRDAHLQTVVGTSLLRGRLGEKRLAARAARTTPHIIDAGDGVRLSGLHDEPANGASKGLALLLHGWEGSVDSSYMRLTAAELLGRGWSTFRLNFRDHGDSHHLNEQIFHSNCIDEVVRAAVEVARRFPAPRMLAAGYSLGGNFTLRLALRAPDAGLRLERVAAVCPVLDPAHTMHAMDRGVGLYRRYFERKWRASLVRKRALFPHLLHLDDRTLAQRLRPLTQWLVERHTDFGTLENYFDGYTLAGERLAALQVPAEILTAADDPVIPVEDFEHLVLAPGTRLTITPHGGHCGFLRNARLDGFAEAWVADVLDRPAGA